MPLFRAQPVPEKLSAIVVMQDLAQGLDVVIAYGPFLFSHVQLQAYVALGKLAGVDVVVVRSRAYCSMPACMAADQVESSTHT